MSILIVLILAVIQGAAELLPISSSAHVILVEKLFGLDPTTPEMTFILVMLHSGTMLAVLVYFWNRWKERLSNTNPSRGQFIKMLLVATFCTGVLGLGLQWLIEKIIFGGVKGAAVEDLFGNLWLIGGALGTVGILILVSGLRRREYSENRLDQHALASSVFMGIAQGLSLPFRGFSRSGATISVGLLCGMSRKFVEEFSFFLAVILTVPVVGRETLRLRASHAASGNLSSLPWLMGLLGLVLSFVTGTLAMRWLSSWLEKGRWSWFGIYCIVLAACIVCLRYFGALN